MSSPVAPPEDGAPPICPRCNDTGIVFGGSNYYPCQGVGCSAYQRILASCSHAAQPPNTVTIYNPDTEALATLKEAVTLHILNVDICDNQAARVSLSRLRSLVSINSTSNESSLIEGEKPR